MKTIFLLKEQLCKEIYNLLVSYGVNEINVNNVKGFNVPVAIDDKKYGVYTLDKLVINVNCDVLAYYSNANGKCDFTVLSYLSLEAICEIKDWLDNNAEEIKRALNEDGAKRTYVFRFHTHGWVDIIVNAESEDKAEELAMETYNEGKYNPDDERFENTHIDNVTAEYMGLD
jgi:uncharacterized protein with GYD domain